MTRHERYEKNKEREKAQRRARYKKNQKKEKEYMREYYKINIDKERERRRRYMKNRRLKLKELSGYTDSEVTKRIKNGEILIPDKCQKCGKKDKLTAHHNDYEKIFEVIFLCRWCHGEVHRKK